MRNTEKFSLVLKLGHQNSRTVDGLSELSYPGWTEGFYLLCFVASLPPPNAQPTFLVVRESLRPMKDLSENLSSSPPSLLAECLCGIKLVFLVGMTAGSEIGAEQRVGTAGGLVRCVLPSGMGTITHLFQPREQKKDHQEEEWLHLPEVLPTSQPLGFFLPDTKHRGRKEGGISAPTDLPELCIPLPGVSMPCVSMFSAVG